MASITRSFLRNVPSKVSRSNIAFRSASSARANLDSTPQEDLAARQKQSQADLIENATKAEDEITEKFVEDPGSITSEDAAYVKSREARVMGQAQPPKGSVSAEAQKLAARNEGATKK